MRNIDSSYMPGLAENELVELCGNPNEAGEAPKRLALGVKLVLGPVGEPVLPPATLETEVFRLLRPLPLKLVPLKDDRSLISSCTVGGVGGLNWLDVGMAEELLTSLS